MCGGRGEAKVATVELNIMTSLFHWLTYYISVLETEPLLFVYFPHLFWLMTT